MIINYWIMNGMGIYTFLASYLFSCLTTTFRWLSVVVALNIVFIFYFDPDIDVWKVHMDFVIHEQKGSINLNHQSQYSLTLSHYHCLEKYCHIFQH